MLHGTAFLLRQGEWSVEGIGDRMQPAAALGPGSKAAPATSHCRRAADYRLDRAGYSPVPRRSWASVQRDFGMRESTAIQAELLVQIGDLRVAIDHWLDEGKDCHAPAQ